MATKEKTWDEQATELGESTMASITDMVMALQCDYDRLDELAGRENDEDDSLEDDEREELTNLRAEAGEYSSEEEARQQIEEDPLALRVRSGWVFPSKDMKPEEFELLLGTGGPAMRIIGDLDDSYEPYNCRLEVQNWFTPWTEYLQADQEVLEAYCRVFWFSN